MNIISNILKILVAALMIGLMVYMVRDILKENEKHPVKGVIQQLYKCPGYRGETESHVVFYSDSLKRKFDVEVSDNSYVNVAVGDTTIIRCTKRDLR